MVRFGGGATRREWGCIVSTVVSKNIPGYMPMDDEPFVGDLAGAHDALVDDVVRMLDDGYEQTFRIETPTDDIVVRPGANVPVEWLRKDVGVQLMEHEEAHVWVYDVDRVHDLGIHFWAVESEVVS